jgi:hypothetical protein
MVFAGTPGLASSSAGAVAIRPSGAKSFRTS